MPRKTAEQQVKEAEARINASIEEIAVWARKTGKLLDKIDERFEAIEARLPRGRKVVQTKMDDSELLETIAPSEEEIATWTPEQVKEFNERELKKMAARKQRQEAKRKEMEGMGSQQRRAAMSKPRDPNEIRIAIDPDYDGDDYVRVQCLRRVGLGNDIMSDINEIVDMPREHAKRLQESGAIRIQL